MHALAVITEQTGISIGLAALVLTALGGCVAALLRRLNSIDANVTQLNARVAEVESDRYSLAQATEHALRIAIENPGLRVPDPRDPTKVVVVQQACKE